MYWNASGGGCSMRPGHIAKLEPVAQNGMEDPLMKCMYSRSPDFFAGVPARPDGLAQALLRVFQGRRGAHTDPSFLASDP